MLITSLHFTPSIDLAIVKLATCVTLLSQADIKGGIRFRYTVSTPGGSGGHHYEGENIDGYGNEMWIDGKEKSISRSTIERAMKTALKMGGKVPGPKALNVPGEHSYLYPIFVRFGVVEP